MKKINVPRSFLTVPHKIKLLVGNPYAVFLLGGLLGVGFFVLTYGLRVVDPTNVNWLLGGGDIEQHFMGWDFFRKDVWSFPLGTIHQLAYPFGISVTYTDSIPLMAIPFKIFTGILPEHFQYFGIWGLICYTLQGGIAAMIMRRWSSSIFVILLCVAVFVVTPMLEARMFAHTALASHWIILASLWALFERGRFDTKKKFMIVWSTLFMIAFAVHPYFIPMVALPFIISLILTHRAWTDTALKVSVPLVASVLLFWVIGGFAVSTKGQVPGGLGEYALNLNSFYNPIGWSHYLMDIPNASNSNETLNYLGLGILLLVPVILYVTFRRYGTVAKLQQLKKKMTLRYILVALSVAILCIVAISPRVQFGTTILADVQLPRKITDNWAIFQASARLFWVVYYMAVVGILVCIIRAFRRSPQIYLVLFLSVFVVIQVIDITQSPNTKERRATFSQISSPAFKHPSSLHVSTWEKYAANKDHMIYMGDMGVSEFFSLVDIAQKYDMTMNTGYFARVPLYDIRQFQAKEMKLLMQRDANMKTNLYIMKDINIVNLLKSRGHMFDQVNDYYIVK